jgi:hypothetical protein
MPRYHLIDTQGGEIVRQYTSIPYAGQRRSYRKSWLERFLRTHEGQIVTALIIGIIAGLCA